MRVMNVENGGEGGCDRIGRGIDRELSERWRKGMKEVGSLLKRTMLRAVSGGVVKSLMESRLSRLNCVRRHVTNRMIDYEHVYEHFISE